MVILNKLPEQTKTGEIATLEELKHQLNIEETDTADDEILARLLDTAIEDVEDFTKSDIYDTANVLTYEIPHFDGLHSTYKINRAPLRTFSKFEIKIADEWVEVNISKYRVYDSFTNFEVHIISALSGTPTALRFTFTTGFTDSKRPKKLKQAALIKAADLYDTERGNYAQGESSVNLKTYERLLFKHVRKYWS